MSTTQFMREVTQSGDININLDQKQLIQELTRLREEVARQEKTINTLQTQATYDALTGLLNRRGFEYALHEALALYRRYKREGAVLMLDLNDFKAINDTLGHMAGDAVLRHVAYVLENHVRDSDVVARLGGDEFVIILREAGPSEVLLKKAELEAVLRTSPCNYDGREVVVSASIGACAFQNESSATLLHLADMEMYRHKMQKNAQKVR